jgi:ribonuclease VapC
VRYVLDASAALAWLNSESGADRVEVAMDDAVISAVNLAEVGTRLVERGAAPSDVDLSLRLLAVPIADFDADLAAVVIKLRGPTRSMGLSLADRACLALAMREGAIALTGDRVWADLDIDCEVELIR